MHLGAVRYLRYLRKSWIARAGTFLIACPSVVLEDFTGLQFRHGRAWFP